MTLLKYFKWLLGSESPLKYMKKGIENHFGGATCSILSRTFTTRSSLVNFLLDCKGCSPRLPVGTDY
ncbi:unnamed protein product [Prunus armeniaca]